MPLYEFKCVKCEVVQEHLCSYKDCPETLPCPRCGAKSEQIVSAPGILTGNMTNPTLDVVIGNDADKRWERLHKRKAQRDKIRKESGEQALRATGRDTYEPLKGARLRTVETPEPQE